MLARTLHRKAPSSSSAQRIFRASQLNDGFLYLVPRQSTARLAHGSPRGDYILPSPIVVRTVTLPQETLRHAGRRNVCPQVAAMTDGCRSQTTLESRNGRRGQRRAAILPAFPPRTTISRRWISTSFTLEDSHSETRTPLPYMSARHSLAGSAARRKSARMSRGVCVEAATPSTHVRCETKALTRNRRKRRAGFGTAERCDSGMGRRRHQISLLQPPPHPLPISRT